MSKIIDITTEAVRSAIALNGMELIDVEYKKMYEDMHLIIYIDKQGGVTLDDCELIHNLIDPIIEDLDPTDGAKYCLDVSSPGLDRPYKTDKDFARNIGGKVEVSLYVSLPPHGKKFTAVLADYDPDNKDIILTVNSTNLTVNYKQIAKINTAIEF